MEILSDIQSPRPDILIHRDTSHNTFSVSLAHPSISNGSDVSSLCGLPQSPDQSLPHPRAPPNKMEIYTASRTMPQMVPCRYWPDNCYYMQTHTDEGTAPKIRRTLTHTSSAYLRESGSNALTVHQSVGDRRY
ncbi:hypothetical protein Sjap_008312 [Stephania japonica]|uniref:Uncharacterized protein n=1 Tax=Stephania japonica TaxID=461633 RepID=A0AAP0JQU4_9MAGN